MPHSTGQGIGCPSSGRVSFVEGVSVSDAPVGKTLTVVINGEDSNARITEIVRVEQAWSPCIRERQGHPNRKAWPWYRHCLDQQVVMMTGERCQAEKVGGELICKVY
jgi:ribosomal protein S8